MAQYAATIQGVSREKAVVVISSKLSDDYQYFEEIPYRVMTHLRWGDCFKRYNQTIISAWLSEEIWLALVSLSDGVKLVITFENDAGVTEEAAKKFCNLRKTLMNL